MLELDVTDEQSRVAAVRRVEAEHGAVGVLVNNAGHGGGGPVEEVPLSLVREVFETNVFGLVRMCQLVLPGMRARRSGMIVNLGSAAGLVTPPTGCPYAMTKYAVESLCDALRPEVAPFGVRVVLIEPGAVRTRFLANSELHKPGGDGNGPYAAYKANVDKMTARAHRDGARAVLDPDDVAEGDRQGGHRPAPEGPLQGRLRRPALPRWRGASSATAGGTRSCAAWSPSPPRNDRPRPGRGRVG